MPAHASRTRRTAARFRSWLPRLLARASALLLLASIAAACAAPERPAPPVAIFLLRHAEKEANDPSDPDLSDAGRARAAALATLLEHAGVTHLYATEFKRTQQTLTPLAKGCGRSIAVVPANAPQQLVATLLELPPGSVAVVAGHSNTIPAIARALGATVDDLETGPEGEVLPDYGRLLLVVISAHGPAHGPASHGAPRTLRLQVGGE